MNNRGDQAKGGVIEIGSRPKDLKWAYPAAKDEVLDNLRTGDPAEGFLHSVLHLCGIDFQPKPEAAKQAGFAFLRAVVDMLDKQLQRQAGGIVETDAVAPPVAHLLKVIAPECAPVLRS